MSIRVDNTAHVFPGLLGWLCLAGLFLATGEWVSSLEKAQRHPVLLSLLALSVVGSSILLVRGADRRRASAYLLALLVTLLSSSLILLGVLGAASARGSEFTFMRRTFTPGLAVVTALPVLFLLLLIVSPVFLLPEWLAGRKRSQLEQAERATMAAAVAQSQEAVRQSPSGASAHLELGRALMRQRSLEANIRPNAPQGFMDPAYRKSLESALDAAIVELREAARLAPQSAEAHGELGDALHLRGSEDALAELRKAVELKSDSPSVHLSLAFALEQQNDWPGAIVAYREAARLQPNAPKIHLHLGKALEHEGDRAAALEAFRRAVELDPANREFGYEFERLQRLRNKGE